MTATEAVALPTDADEVCLDDGAVSSNPVEARLLDGEFLYKWAQQSAAAEEARLHPAFSTG
jgi:hypothetical protein